MLRAFSRSILRKKIPAVFTLGCLTLLLSACASSHPGSQAGSRTDDSRASGKIQSLAYGAQILVPDGWVIENAVPPEAATKPALDARTAKGERIMLLSMHRPASGLEGKDALVALFLVDSGRNFPPEERTARLTQEELDGFGPAILARDREAAAHNKSQSNLLSWRVSKTLMDGKLTLVHRGTARGPEGVLNLCDVNMYLPNGKGLALKSMSDPRVPGTEQIIETTINSLRVQ